MTLTAFSDPFSLYFLIAPHYFMGEENHGSMRRFHFFDGKFLGRWYPKGLTAKRMVF